MEKFKPGDKICGISILGVPLAGDGEYLMPDNVDYLKGGYICLQKVGMSLVVCDPEKIWHFDEFEKDYQNVMDIEVGDTVRCIGQNKSNFYDHAGAGFYPGLEFVVTQIHSSICNRRYNIYFGGKNNDGVYSDAVRLVKRKNPPVEPDHYNFMDGEVGDVLECIVPNNPLMGTPGAGYEEGLQFIVTSVVESIHISTNTPMKIYFGANNTSGVYSECVKLVRKKDEPINTLDADVGDIVRCVGNGTSKFSPSGKAGSFWKPGFEFEVSRISGFTTSDGTKFKIYYPDEVNFSGVFSDAVVLVSKKKEVSPVMPTQIVKGIWYKFTWGTGFSIAKADMVTKEAMYFKEVISTTRGAHDYKIRVGKWIIANADKIESVSLDEIQQYLPSDHPDKRPVQSGMVQMMGTADPHPWLTSIIEQEVTDAFKRVPYQPLRHQIYDVPPLPKQVMLTKPKKSKEMTVNIIQVSTKTLKKNGKSKFIH